MKFNCANDWLKIRYTFYMYSKFSSSSFFPFKNFQMFQLSLFFLLFLDLLKFWLWELCLFIEFFWKHSTQYLITLEIKTLNYFQCICLKVILLLLFFQTEEVTCPWRSSVYQFNTPTAGSEIRGRGNLSFKFS